MEKNSYWVLICQGRSCRHLGSQKVLEAFRKEAVPKVDIIESGCLGQCGNGPMVLILPDQVWYWRICAENVPLLVEQHLRHGCPVTVMLYPQFQG